MAVANQIAYIAEGGAGLEVIDVHDPASPLSLAVVAVAGNVGSVQVAGNVLYAACGAAGLRIFDVSNPSAPVLLAASWPRQRRR